MAFYYFAYGSCMSQKSLARSGVRFKQIGRAVLCDHRLAFSRLAPSGGVADIIPKAGHEVEGVLYEVRDFHTLDKREGAPYAYRRVRKRVYSCRHGRCLWVWTYEVVRKSSVQYAPSRSYAALLLEGASILSRAYRRKLKRKIEQARSQSRITMLK